MYTVLYLLIILLLWIATLMCIAACIKILILFLMEHCCINDEEDENDGDNYSTNIINNLPFVIINPDDTVNIGTKLAN